MNRTARLLVMGTGLVTGAMFMAGPAQASDIAEPCCDHPAPSAGVSETGGPDSVEWVNGPWFPEPDDY